MLSSCGLWLRRHLLLSVVFEPGALPAAPLTVQRSDEGRRYLLSHLADHRAGEALPAPESAESLLQPLAGHEKAPRFQEPGGSNHHSGGGGNRTRLGKLAKPATAHAFRRIARKSRYLQCPFESPAVSPVAWGTQ